MHDKEWNEILKESRRARTCQIGKALNNKHIWVKDIISTIDREISDFSLPEGEYHRLNKRDHTLLIDNLIKDLESKLEIFPDNINIRLANGKAIYKPYPAYYTGYDNNEGTIHFQQAIYWQGTLEIILTEDIIVNSSIIFTEGQILGKLKNKRLMYTREIPIPLKLAMGILNENNEVPEFKIHSWNEKLISWRKGNFSAPLDWFNKFKSIISDNGIEGLVESDWITSDIADFINKRLTEKRKEKRLAVNKPFNFLSNEFDRIIDQDWEGKASDLFEKLNSKEIIPTARKLGILLSRGAREGLPPGWEIKSIRIGNSRQQGYLITRL